MNALKIIVAAFSALSAVNVLAVAPDPNVPNPPLTTMEANVDENGWIAVHEQGEAAVNIVNEEAIDVNVTGGEVEASITGGQVEVTNDVSVKNADGDVLEVEIVANEAPHTRLWSQNLYFGMDPDQPYGWFDQAEVDEGYSYEKRSVVCEVTSNSSLIRDALIIEFYTSNSGGTPDVEYTPPDDICTDFTPGFSNGEFVPIYTYYCRSDSTWEDDTQYIYAVVAGNPSVPIQVVRCKMKGNLILH
jgi:hypothetical protein